MRMEVFRLAETIKVVLADDHPIVRGGISALLGQAGDIEVVGEAGPPMATVRTT